MAAVAFTGIATSAQYEVATEMLPVLTIEVDAIIVPATGHAPA